MKTRMIEKPTGQNFKVAQAAARVPEAADVANLKVGDLAPDAFGQLKPVTRIHARSTDRTGRAFVCYYTQMTKNDSSFGCSQSMKEGELIRTVALTGLLDSAECDELERAMQ